MSKKMNKRHSKINNIIAVEDAAHNLGILPTGTVSHL